MKLIDYFKEFFLNLWNLEYIDYHELLSTNSLNEDYLNESIKWNKHELQLPFFYNFKTKIVFYFNDIYEGTS